MVEAIKIRNGLIEAYKGYYEEERDIVRKFTTPEGSFQTELFDDTPKERLERYLVWEGIFGYTDTIFDITMGKLS